MNDSSKYKNLARTIYIPTPADRDYTKFGWLSNTSYHSFILQGKRWPTVEHFVHAQKFQGTTMEETIRNAQTISIVKNLIKPQTLLVYDQDTDMAYRKTVYGKDQVEKERIGIL